MSRLHVGALCLGRWPDGALAERHRAACGTEVSYADIGCTLPPGRLSSAGYTLTLPVGQGQAAFDGAVRGLREWAPHRALGARVHPPTAPVEQGVTVLVGLRFGPFELVVPDRIVRCIDEPGRFGFAYGTLPGHLERGEESFLVRLEPDGTVTATVTFVAGPAYRLVAVGSPIVRVLQRRAVRVYLAALRQAAAGLDRP